MTSLVSRCARIVNQNMRPTLLHDRADVTLGYILAEKKYHKAKYDFCSNFTICQVNCHVSRVCSYILFAGLAHMFCCTKKL